MVTIKQNTVSIFPESNRSVPDKFLEDIMVSIGNNLLEMSNPVDW